MVAGKRPSGKRLHNYGKSPCCEWGNLLCRLGHGFNSYAILYQRVNFDLIVSPDEVLFMHFRKMFPWNIIAARARNHEYENRWRYCYVSQMKQCPIDIKYRIMIIMVMIFPSWPWNNLSNQNWLVVEPTPLKNMSSSLGMITFPIYGKIKIVKKMFQSTNLCLNWMEDQ